MTFMLDDQIIKGHLTINSQNNSKRHAYEVLLFDSVITFQVRSMSFQGEMETFPVLIIHGWVFTDTSIVRETLFDNWYYFQKLKHGTISSNSESRYYYERSKYFKTDSKENISLTLDYTIDGNTWQQVSTVTGKNGHFYLTLLLLPLSPASTTTIAMATATQTPTPVSRLPVLVSRQDYSKLYYTGTFSVAQPQTIKKAKAPGRFNLKFLNLMQVYLGREPTQTPTPSPTLGPSLDLINLSKTTHHLLISDIDDTIKITEVTDRKKMLENTFLNVFKEVSGMSSCYRQLVSSKAVNEVYYVSSSPWQLGIVLKEFLDQNGFPHSENLSLRQLVANNFERLWEFLEDSSSYKLIVIRNLIATKVQFFASRGIRLIVTLVGDEGEHDPEIYDQIALEYPSLIKNIYIRDLHRQQLWNSSVTTSGLRPATVGANPSTSFSKASAATTRMIARAAKAVRSHAVTTIQSSRNLQLENRGPVINMPLINKPIVDRLTETNREKLRIFNSKDDFIFTVRND